MKTFMNPWISTKMLLSSRIMKDMFLKPLQSANSRRPNTKTVKDWETCM